MTDIIFGVLYIVTLVAFAIYVIETNKEKAKLVNALIAKTPEQARDLTLADKVQQIEASNPNVAPDVVPLESVSDDEFEQHIKQQLK